MQKLHVGTWKENSKIFNEDFYLPLYLPLCLAPSGFVSKMCIVVRTVTNVYGNACVVVAIK